jgi:hypothetical protein
MPLPKLVAPTYELVLPSTEQKIKFRPFLVKEEKILLLAMESEDEKQMTEAVKTILKNCILSKVKVEELPVFDIEYIFLNIRSKAVGEEIELNVTCPDDGETEVKVKLNIDDIQVIKPEGHNRVIKLNDTVAVQMKYPSMETFIKNNFSGSGNVEDVFELASSCIEQVAEGEDVYETKSFSKKELNDFMDSMDTAQFMMLQNFFETMPRLSHTIKVTNPDTKVESEIVLEGLASFLG